MRVKPPFQLPPEMLTSPAAIGNSGHHFHSGNPTPPIWGSRNIAPSTIKAIPVNLLLCITSYLSRLMRQARRNSMLNAGTS